MSGCGTAPGQVWRFEASLGVVGVPTVDGRVLGVPALGEERSWTRELPLPVLAYRHVSKPGEEHRIAEELLAVAKIEEVRLRGMELVACGVFGDMELGWHYAGALAVDAVTLAVNLDDTTVEARGQDLVEFTGWRVAGAVLVHDSPWPPGSLSRPRVWAQECVTW